MENIRNQISAGTFQDRRQHPVLDEGLIELIAERAAEKAVAKMEDTIYEKVEGKFYEKVGASVVGKLYHLVGAITIGIAVYLTSKGYIKVI